MSRFQPQDTVFRLKTEKTYVSVCPYCEAHEGEVARQTLNWKPEVGVMHCFACGRGGLVAKCMMSQLPPIVVRGVEL